MIRFAVIGTNWISDKFVQAAHETGLFRLVAVYSRQVEQAEKFAQQYGVKCYFTSLDELAKSDDIDAVYIASPNSCHYQQAQLLLEHKKHVICEKPLTSNSKQTNALIKTAKAHSVVLFEAFKTSYLPNFAQIQTYLPKLGQLRKVFFNYCQYSSRYPRYLAGDNPNTFNPEFSNGSIMDIGVYCLGAAVALWGKPQQLQASATLLDSGVDAHGSVIMNYGRFDAVIFHSKVSDSLLASEIQGEEGVLLIEHLSVCEKVTFIPRGGVPQDITLSQKENALFYEAERFAELINNNQIEHPGLTHSLTTAALLTEVRQQTGIVFPADSL